MPGKRLKLHPDDYYSFGAHRGGMKGKPEVYYLNKNFFAFLAQTLVCKKVFKKLRTPIVRSNDRQHLLRRSYVDQGAAEDFRKIFLLCLRV